MFSTTHLIGLMDSFHNSWNSTIVSKKELVFFPCCLPYFCMAENSVQKRSAHYTQNFLIKVSTDFRGIHKCVLYAQHYNTYTIEPSSDGIYIHTRADADNLAHKEDILLANDVARSWRWLQYSMFTTILHIKPQTLFYQSCLFNHPLITCPSFIKV